MLTQFPRSEILSPVCFTYAFNYIGGRTKVLTLSSQTKWMAQLIQFQLLWLWGLLVVLVGVNHKSHTNSNLSHISNNVFNYVVYLPSVICIINPFLQRVTPPLPTATNTNIEKDSLIHWHVQLSCPTLLYR